MQIRSVFLTRRFPTVKLLVSVVVLLCLLTTPVWAREITDKDINLAVQTKLQHDEGVAAHLIDVDTQKGIITLSGRVDNLLAKDRATQVAETIKGVRSVVNNIQVKTAARRDEDIHTDVRNALVFDPATEAYEVGVTVHQGILTLNGLVDSWQEKQLCAQVAKGVKGVKGVRNQIKVKRQGDRRDAEIQTEIQRALASDVWVDESSIKVSVTSGKVVLEGAVGSVAEKSRALTIARVRGVESVDVSGLEVHWTAKAHPERGSKYMPVTDGEIKKAVEDAFVYDPRVAPFEVYIMVDDGVVILSGVVDNLRAKEAAAEDAWNTTGVLRVKNHIKVRPRVTVAQNDLRNRVKDMLSRDPIIERHEITVSVVNGKVFLYGKVDSRYERRRAEVLTSRVKGVVAVSNNLEVETPDWWLHGKSDRALQQDINDELWWSPYVDSDQVSVAVNNGVVTLTGTVDNWREWRAAQENAFDAGALKVRNKIKVQ